MRNRTSKYDPQKRDGFYRLLAAEVQQYLRHQRNGRFANRFMLFKIFFCLIVFLIAYAQYINPNLPYSSWLLWCLALGVSSMLVGVNMGHDAVHGALFPSKTWNRLAGFGFDLIGISSFTWKLKHNLVHHHFPNVTEVDYDIEAGPLLRLSPHDPLRRYHRFQHLYAPLIYMLFSLHLVFLNDIRIFREWQQGKRVKKQNFLIRVLPGKLLYLFLMVLLPPYLLPFAWWQLLTGFLFMHFCLSLILALILLPSHLFEQTQFTSRNEKGLIVEDWALHQMVTTLDFSQQNRLVHFLFGGFNTNVIHHLFPHVCHCHYKKLSKILEEKSRQLQLPYQNTSMPLAILSHFKALKKLGTSGFQPSLYDNAFKRQL